MQPFSECSNSAVIDLSDVGIPADTQESAVRNLIIRTIGEDASKSFAVHVDKTMPSKSFQVGLSIFLFILNYF